MDADFKIRELIVGPLVLVGFLIMVGLSATLPVFAQNCPWHCQTWTNDGCDCCDCVKGKLQNCTKSPFCDEPRRRGRCTYPTSASLYRPNDCKWFGTAPWCSGSCPIGFNEVMRDAKGHGKNCRRGTKVYCCPQHRGQGAATCYAYAEKAIQQYRRGIAANCTLVGPQWNPNFDAHYDWCIQLANIQDATNGIQLRENFLNTGCR